MIFRISVDELQALLSSHDLGVALVPLLHDTISNLLSYLDTHAYADTRSDIYLSVLRKVVESIRASEEREQKSADGDEKAEAIDPPSGKLEREGVCTKVWYHRYDIAPLLTLSLVCTLSEENVIKFSEHCMCSDRSQLDFFLVL